jgi:hypothetical protein
MCAVNARKTVSPVLPAQSALLDTQHDAASKTHPVLLAAGSQPQHLVMLLVTLPIARKHCMHPLL